MSNEEIIEALLILTVCLRDTVDNDRFITGDQLADLENLIKELNKKWTKSRSDKNGDKS